jgi:hypothetical protein
MESGLDREDLGGIQAVGSVIQDQYRGDQVKFAQELESVHFPEISADFWRFVIHDQ